MGPSNFNLTLILTLTWLVVVINNPVNGQYRSLLHWRKDLEFQLNSYLNQRNVIGTILATSIRPPNEIISGSARVSARGNVRFSDLIIPNGSLILDSGNARPAMKVMVSKTQTYVNSKMNELDQIQGQLDLIRRQLGDPSQRFIYKGLPNTIVAQLNSSVIPGTRVFKQFQYARMIDTRQIELKLINFTNVDHVINETYMKNSPIALTDSQSRLFFEGRKTFRRSVFVKQLNSGCCDRLKPLHTSRMMTRSTNQLIKAPVWLLTSDQYNTRQPTIIQRLRTNQLVNKGFYLDSKNPGQLLVQTQGENLIQLHNLINIRQPVQLEILKTLVFKDLLMIEEAKLFQSYKDNRLVIGFISSPNLQFDLSHDNYLLKYSTSKSNSTLPQQVTGSVVVNSEVHFVRNLDAESVNRVPSFYQFVVGNIVRIDRPAVIRGSIRFNALPAMFTSSPSLIQGGGLLPQPSRLPQNVLIMHSSKGLQVGLVNGMRLPYDLVLLPQSSNQLIRISGSRQFSNRVFFKNLVQVRQLVNGMQMPASVIPLHLNDFISSVGSSNLWFIDGIAAHHITVHSGQFDDIILKDLANGDAQNVIMRSMFTDLPDGSRLIRAPLRVRNLKLFGQSGTPRLGLLNGFRPQDVIELSEQPIETIYGKKTFNAHVEVTECNFNDINHLNDWTNHLIRIDQPNTVQTIQTKLAFIRPPAAISQYTNSTVAAYQPAFVSSVNIDKFRIDFHPNNNPTNYLSNLKISPEFYVLHQALLRGVANHTEGRYRVLDQVNLVDSYGRAGRINGIDLNDIVTLDKPFRFADRFVMVGKVDVMGAVRANRINSNYPIDAMDLVQFNNYRIPITGSRGPIRLNNLVLSTNNRASYIRCHMLNGISFNEFVNSIMSLTRPQAIDSNLVFAGPTNFEGFVRTQSSLNGVKEFKKFAYQLKTARYSFEDGLQCNSIMIKV